VLAVAVLVGCSGPSDSGSSGADSAAPGVVDPEPVPSAGPGTGPADPVDADPDRQVVTTATASLTVDDPADGAQRVSELVQAAGGRVDERTERAGSGGDEGGDDGGGDAAADLVVRVPAAALTGLLADLADLGEVTDVSVSRSDVTATAVDVDARISALRTSVARLQGLMDGAATTEALLAAEAALAERQQELEALQSQRALLADQVELSTLTVHLQPYGVVPAGGPDGFLDGLATGWRALVVALGAVVVVLGVVLPWLVLAAALTAAVLLPLGWVRRRAAAVTPAPAQD